LQDCTLPDAVRAIVGLHVRDETRHVAYARDRLIRDLPRAGRTARAAYGALLSVAIRQFGRTCFYPPPAAYAAAGIAEPRRLAQAVRASAKRAALIEECMAPARDVLGEYLSLR
jgi:P-aminobenzoate N-oxygenase AurF